MQNRFRNISEAPGLIEHNTKADSYLDTHMHGGNMPHEEGGSDVRNKGGSLLLNSCQAHI